MLMWVCCVEKKKLYTVLTPIAIDVVFQIWVCFLREEFLLSYYYLFTSTDGSFRSSVTTAEPLSFVK